MPVHVSGIAAGSLAAYENSEDTGISGPSHTDCSLTQQAPLYSVKRCSTRALQWRGFVLLELADRVKWCLLRDYRIEQAE